MKIEIKTNEDVLAELEKEFVDLSRGKPEEIQEIFKLFNDGDMIFSQFVKMFYFADGLKGKNVLDIGCGCTESDRWSWEQWYIDDGWEPHLARFLSQLGANVIGIDLGKVEQEKESYTHIRANLVHSNLKEVIPQGFKPDIVMANNFFGSPTLSRNLHNRASTRNFYSRLFKEIPEIMPSGSVFFTDSREIGIYDENYKLIEEKSGRPFLESSGFSYLGEVGFHVSEAYRKR